MQKLYYSISEVCRMVDEEQHILRYWEKEFPQLKPRKNRGGNRIYSEKDITLIKLIKSFLREEKLSLKGAKEQILKALNDDTTKDTPISLTDIHDSSNEIGFNSFLKIDKSKKKDSVTLKKEELVEIINLFKRFSLVLKQIQ